MALFITIASLVYLLYVIAIYPLLLAFAAARAPVRRKFSAPLPTVSVILPVHNGERFIRAKLETLFALDYPPELMQILIVSDGSTDATDDVVRANARGRVELIRVSQGGKALAINAGLARATGGVLFFTDVRQTLSTNALRDLVADLADPEVGAATGELVIRSDQTIGEGPGLYWRYEVGIRSCLSRVGMLQGATGCIYAMRREYAVALPQHTLLDDVYMPLSAFFAGKRIVFDPAAKAFDYPTELDVEFRRKVRTLAGVYQVIGAYPRLLWPGTRGWVHFTSHKLGRLLMPFAVLALLISTFWLPSALRIPLLAGQAIVYGLALLDLALPASFPLKRISAPASTFVVLMAAAFGAALAQFFPAERLWKQTAIRQPANSSMHHDR